MRMMVTVDLDTAKGNELLRAGTMRRTRVGIPD